MMRALYSSTTGLKSHSTGMGVISNNVANVNTIAYKSSNILYADLMSQYQTGSADYEVTMSQLGMGAAVMDVRTSFTQGSLEASSTVTDLAINGIGFFGVLNDNGQVGYTRAGNFRFTAQGALVDAAGWTLMGYSIANGVESSQAGPIVLDYSESGDGSMAGKGTTVVNALMQLGNLSNATSNSQNEFFALASSWNGTAATPLTGYSHSQEIQFYDNSGTLQSATIYFDLAETSGGQSVVEYVVAMDPSIDESALAGTSAAGLLMAGTMTFSSSGELVNVTGFLPPSSGDPADLASWTAASLSGDGYPQFQATIGGQAQSIALNFGLSVSGSASAGLASAADAAANSAVLYEANGTLNEGQSSHAGGDTNTSLGVTYDGYATGFLTDVTVTDDGLIRGIYSNGEYADLFRIPLFRFTSEDGLEELGDNHWGATTASGEPTAGIPGTENFGTISEYKLEQSNVDLATEFSNMIITQRGFQMNSKMITTCDTMLQKAMEIKR